MIKLTGHDSFYMLCKATKKWGVYISFGNEDCSWEEIIKAAPYLSFDKDYEIIANGHGIILFDSKEEMENIYNQTVGDDGPTELNLYNGPARVYAMTCSADGQPLTENT